MDLVNNMTLDCSYRHNNDTMLTPDVNNSLVQVLHSGNEVLRLQTSRLKIGILASYLVTMVCGLVGNGLVVYIIGRNAQIRKKSVANYYIWNLAFADLLFILTMPFFCYSTYYNSWPFGVVICKMAAAFKETMRYTSMFTLAVLSFDRYLASFYNRTHLRTIRVGIAVCCMTWVMSGTIAIPYAMYAQLQRNQCGVVLPSVNVIVFMAYFELASALIVPLVLISISYTLLAFRLSAILRPGIMSSTSVQRPNRRMTKTILVVIITFLVCQTPYHVNNILNVHRRLAMSQHRITPTVHDILVAMYLNTTSTILVFISSCCNPIIYGILNDNYRALYRAVMCCCCYGTISGAGHPCPSSKQDSIARGRLGWRFPSFINDHSSSTRSVNGRGTSLTTSTAITEHLPIGQIIGEEEDEEEEEGGGGREEEEEVIL